MPKIKLHLQSSFGPFVFVHNATDFSCKLTELVSFRAHSCQHCRSDHHSLLEHFQTACMCISPSLSASKSEFLISSRVPSAVLHGSSQHPCERVYYQPCFTYGAQQPSSEVQANFRDPVSGWLTLCTFKALTDFRSRYFPSLDLRSGSHKLKLRHSGVPMQARFKRSSQPQPEML